LRKKVVIIGAGIAGLTAARELIDEFDVIILEAAAAPGGRCRTITHKGNPLELGAGFMQGSIDNNPFARIAAEYGLRWAPSASKRTIYLNGKKLSAAVQTRAEDFLVAAPQILQQSGHQDAVAEFYQHLEDSAQKLAIEMLAGPTETGCELSALSVHDVADQHETGEFATITGGWTEFLNNYARGLNIRYHESVTAINWTGSQLVLTTPTENFAADHAIITASVGSLNDGIIRFMPLLPDVQAQALPQLHMGILNKYFLCWKNSSVLPDEWPVYWRNGAVQFEIWPHENPSIWVVVIGGDQARRLEQQPVEEAVQMILSELRKLDSTCCRENLDWFYTTQWATDSITRGAYSALRPGADKNTRALAGTSANKKLFFAGEAYDTEYATTITGAYLSGLRAAQEIRTI